MKNNRKITKKAQINAFIAVLILFLHFFHQISDSKLTKPHTDIGSCGKTLSNNIFLTKFIVCASS